MDIVPARPRRGFLRRRLAAATALIALLLPLASAFETARDLLRFVSSADWSFALTASEDQRIRRRLGGLHGIYDAIREHTASGHGAVFCLFRPEMDRAAEYFHLASLLHPVRLIPVLKTPAIHPDLFPALRAEGKSFLVLERDSGIAAVDPAWFEPVATGAGFTLHRFRAAR